MTMNRNILFTAILSLFTTIASAQMRINLGADAPLRKLQIAEMAINNLYVDSVDERKLVEDGIRGMLEKLDPHSSYLTPKEVKAANEPLQGNFEGIGVQFNMVEDTLLVIQPVTNGPSEKVGILAGDRIVKVNDTIIAGVKMSKEEIMRRLRGPKGTKVRLGIVRREIADTLLFTVVRDKIPVHSIDASYMLRPQIGYIRIGSFGATTYDEFCNAVKDLKAKGMERLVLDLRDNSGGLLSAALGICDELLPDRELIVYTQGAHQRRQEEHSSRGGLFCKGELIVMIDEYSASASEIVAGAVQDNDRGLIVGRRSFGKGLVQQRFPLPDRSAIQLTTSRYYTPSGRCIQRPYNKGTDEYYADFAQNIIDEYDGDSTLYKINDSTPYYTAKGRTVYGGGGIYPDHTIHYKSDENVVYYNRLLNKGLLSDYIFDYVSYKGSTIKQKHPTEESFLKNYTVSDAMLEQLFANAEKKGIARDAKGIARYREEIRTRIKAGIGDMLYSNNAFYYLLLPYDPELKEALTFMK